MVGKANFTRPAARKTVKKAVPVKPASKPAPSRTTTTPLNRVTSRIDPGSPAAKKAAAAPLNRVTSRIDPGSAAAKAAALVAALAAKKTAGNPVKVLNQPKAANPIIKTPAPTSRPTGSTSRVTSPLSGARLAGATSITGNTAPIAPIARPTSIQGNVNPTTPGFSSLAGRNVTAGQFNRRRLGRGPLANESLTPEELRRIASQRVNNYG